MSQERWDVIVVGGGIAGVSIGYELAEEFSVVLLEMEPTLAYHTTGRSAATWLSTYGNEPIRALTKASRDFLNNPCDIFHAPLTAPLGLIYIGGPGQAAAVRARHDEVAALTPDVRLISADEASAINPVLRPGYLELGMVEPGALDVDVHELHQGYVRGLRSRGGRVVTCGKVVGAASSAGVWTLTTADGRTFSAPLVVDAAGAWADEVAGLLGATPVGIAPLRRTIFMVSADDLPVVPMTFSIDDTFYFRSERGQYLCSPADATPQPPGDAKPDELEIARAIEAINEATTLGIRHVRAAWAGLRSFAPDRTPVIGFDANVDGLFWFAGQGGYGIQICPAAARLGAELVTGAQPNAVEGLDIKSLRPERFAW